MFLGSDIDCLAIGVELLEGWLALTSVKYHDNLLVLMLFNPLRPNSDPSQTSHCNIKSLSVSEVMRIENMITEIRIYRDFNSFSPLVL